MLFNFFKIAYRNLIRDKLYTIINIFGLALGIACVVIVALYVKNELSYDQFHKNADQIYRVTQHVTSQDGEEKNASVQLLVGGLLRDEFPEIQNLVRFWRDFSPLASGESPVIKYGENQFREKSFYYADSTVFEMFSFPFVRGSAETAFKNPYSVVITESTAKKYFGDENPVGKSLKIVDSNTDLTVTGVLQDLPETSHIQFDLLSPFHLLEQIWKQRYGVPHILGSLWTWNNTWVYIQLPENVKPGQLESKFEDFVQRNLPEEFRNNQSLHLQSILDIHLYSDMGGEMQANGNATDMYIFSGIALFILLVASINFMNLATARSLRRTREVAVRKAAGASKKELIIQFLGESVLLSLLSGVVVLMLIQWLTPVFNTLVNLNLNFFAPGNELIYLATGVLLIGVGLLSGLYPALILSSFKPANILKGQLTASANNIKDNRWLREGLVVLQFGISIFMIVAAISVYRQVNFMKDKDLGFNTDHIVMVNVEALGRRERFTTFVDELIRHQNIVDATTTESVPGRFVYDYYLRPEGVPKEETMSIPYLWTDSHFADVFQLEFIKGEEISKNTSRFVYVLNESAVNMLGWEGDALGKKIYREQNGQVVWQGEVTGIVKDFHFRSLHNKIDPLILGVVPQQRGEFKTSFGYGIFRVKPEEMQQTISYMEATWNEIAPGRTFEYFFLDENLKSLYNKEADLQKLVGYLSILAIFIACMGLFGLAALTVTDRVKEIGIRKVLGATKSDIILLINKKFLRILIIALFVSAPISWVAVNRWLNEFAYRVEFSLFIILIAGLLLFMVCTITVSYQSLKATLVNPADSLRSE